MSKWQYTLFFLQTLFIVGIICFIFGPTVDEKGPVCDCHHGAVMEKSPQCKCLCFGSYLQPNCLYKAEEQAELKLWLFSDGDVPDEYPLSRYDVIKGLNWAFGLDPKSTTFSFLRYVVTMGGGTNATEEEWDSHTTNCTIVMVLVTMPGWAAQNILSDAASGKISDYTMRNSITRTNYTIRGVSDETKGPPLPIRYPYESIALYTDTNSYLFITMADCGWFIGALTMVTMLLRIEVLWMTNVDFGGPGFVSRRGTSASISGMPSRRGSASSVCSLNTSKKSFVGKNYADRRANGSEASKKFAAGVEASKKGGRIKSGKSSVATNPFTSQPGKKPARGKV
ncbi:hypothetical protein TRVL_01749 [Trypanosoma vivax]|nr:hypothetical protein TRVL_01749 [Trypanosoma vivax]